MNLPDTLDAVSDRIGLYSTLICGSGIPIGQLMGQVADAYEDGFLPELVTEASENERYALYLAIQVGLLTAAREKMEVL